MLSKTTNLHSYLSEFIKILKKNQSLNIGFKLFFLFKYFLLKINDINRNALQPVYQLTKTIRLQPNSIFLFTNHFTSSLNLFDSILSLFNSPSNLFNSLLNHFNSPSNLFNSSLNLFNSLLSLFNSLMNLFNSMLSSF